MRWLRRSGLLVAALGLACAMAGCGTGTADTDTARAPVALTANPPASTPVASTPVASTPVASALAAKKRGVTKPATGGVPVKLADHLYGLSCLGGDCFAVGDVTAGSTSRTLIEAWNGTAWRVEASPGNRSDSGLTAISCAAPARAPRTAAPGSCLVTGSPALAGRPTLTGSGGRWRTVAANLPMTSVSCARADSCVAVGWTTKDLTFTTWPGTTPRTGVMHAAPPQAQTFTMDGVSCAAVTNCVAVGDYAWGQSAQPSPKYRDQVLAERWNGRSWRLLPTVNVGHVDQFSAVSCVSASHCTAVGASQQQFPLAERWNGVSWRVEPMPTVSSIGYVQLTGVSCPASTFCVAAGNYQGLPITETWNGTKWRIAELPQPPNDNHFAELNAVSCASPSSCVAVGMSGLGRSFAEVDTNGTWHVSATRNPT